jgi:hypothetical protein
MQIITGIFLSSHSLPSIDIDFFVLPGAAYRSKHLVRFQQYVYVYIIRIWYLQQDQMVVCSTKFWLVNDIAGTLPSIVCVPL